MNNNIGEDLATKATPVFPWDDHTPGYSSKDYTPAGPLYGPTAVPEKEPTQPPSRAGVGGQSKDRRRQKRAYRAGLVLGSPPVGLRSFVRTYPDL